MTRYVIDARQIRWNAAILRRESHGVPVIGVVKCDAYGAGLLPVSRILLDEGAVAALAVLHFHEAETLRRSGVGAPILMLTPAVTAAEADTVLRLNPDRLGRRRASCALLESAAERAGKTVPVHLMLDTGFGRFGWLPDETGALLRDLKRCPRLRVEPLSTPICTTRTPPARKTWTGSGCCSPGRPTRSSARDSPSACATWRRQPQRCASPKRGWTPCASARPFTARPAVRGQVGLLPRRPSGVRGLRPSSACPPATTSATAGCAGRSARRPSPSSTPATSTAGVRRPSATASACATGSVI